MPLGEDRPTVLAKYGAYVRSLASTVRRQFRGSLDFDELVAWGQVGLLEAAERFDPKIGANFLTFAHYRIKGAIFDGLRKMGVLGASDARLGAAERANSYLGNLSARESGGNRGGSFADDVREVSGAVAGLAMVFATSLEGTEGLQIADGAMPVDERLEIEQLRGRVKEAVTRLPAKERTLLEAYYFQGKTLEEAGGALGLSKSWASRLHARAIDQLKDMLGEEGPARDTRRTEHDRTPGGSRGQPGRADRPAEGPGAAADQGAGSVKVRPGPGA